MTDVMCKCGHRGGDHLNGDGAEQVCIFRDCGCTKYEPATRNDDYAKTLREDVDALFPEAAGTEPDAICGAACPDDLSLICRAPVGHLGPHDNHRGTSWRTLRPKRVKEPERPEPAGLTKLSEPTAEEVEEAIEMLQDDLRASELSKLLANKRQLLATLAELESLKQSYAALVTENSRLKQSLGIVYDKWENGIPCHESSDGQIDEDSSHIGNAFRLSFAEEQEILNLIVDKAEDFEQACANCNKPYRAHLLHDGNKCAPGNVPVWFPSTIATALATAKKLTEATQ